MDFQLEKIKIKNIISIISKLFNLTVLSSLTIQFPADISINFYRYNSWVVMVSDGYRSKPVFKKICLYWNFPETRVRTC